MVGAWTASPGALDGLDGLPLLPVAGRPVAWVLDGRGLLVVEGRARFVLWRVPD